VYKHILIATDGSELAQKAVEQGLALAKVLQAQVLIVTVTEPWTAVVSGEMGIVYPIDDYEKAVAGNAAKILADAAESARRSGQSCETLHVKDQFPAEGIVEAANAKNCDLIVMASHGRRGLTRILLGSQASSVVTHSKVPVLICR
jgi:nucleotide-binding universal stress UspA family protein